MIRTAIAIFAVGLLAYPLWCLVSPESYRLELEELYGAAEATTAQLQMVAGIHWLKNACLAYAFLLLARYIGQPDKPADLRRAGALLTGFPLVEVLYQFFAQLAMSSGAQDLSVNIQLTSDFLLYCVLGLALIGIARTIGDTR